MDRYKIPTLKAALNIQRHIIYYFNSSWRLLAEGYRTFQNQFLFTWKEKSLQRRHFCSESAETK
jgi:hypothetical protein